MQIEMTPEQVYALLNQGAINDARNELARIDLQLEKLYRRRVEVESEIARRSQRSQIIRTLA